MSRYGGSIIGNVNAGRVRIFKINTFKALTEAENKIHKDKSKKRPELDCMIHENTEIRNVDGALFYLKTDDGGIDKSKDNGKYQIAVFESDITRLALSDRGIEKADMQLIDDIIYMEVFHNEIMWQILRDGIKIADEEYILYSATTGQVRNTTITLMKKSFFEKYKGFLYVGLTKDTINGKGGMNAGKFLAYTALPLSSSVLPDSPIDIDKCILVKGLETVVKDKVKYVDIQMDANGELIVADTPKEYIEKEIPIEHTDGAGMFLPGALHSSCQIRSGFFKGAMFPFDFKLFATEVAHNTTISDAWNKPVDIIENDVKFIFTTSQLKMWKFFDSWDDYKRAFKENQLHISINSYANPAKDEVTFAYQYLQTLPYGSDIKELCKKTKDLIRGLHKDIEVVKRVMGYDIEDMEDSENRGANLQIAEAIQIYPQIVNDTWITTKIDKVARSIRKNAKGGKIFLNGYYSYASPDMYAFCEYLFCGNNNPNGLVPKNHIYNKYYDEKGNIEHVVCLRSPHLSGYEYGKRDLVKSDECRKWFQYMEFDTVVSCHDLLSKTLQMDWDGDEILVSPDEELYRLTPDLPPLYYEMQTADSKLITNEAIYDTLVKGFDNNVIGDVSNIITKMWNTPLADESENHNPFDDAINVFCAYSNYSIDYPKTGKNIKLGDWQKLYDQYTPSKEAFAVPEILFPDFFKEAKGKKDSSIYKPTKSVMDRIKKEISSGTGRMTYSFKSKDEKFNYCMLMNNEKTDDKAKYEVDRYGVKYAQLYRLIKELKKQKSILVKDTNKIIAKGNTDSGVIAAQFDLFHYQCVRRIKEVFTDKGFFNEELAVNYFVDLEYCQHDFATSSKDMLWKCFGHVLLKNLKQNVNSDVEIKTRPRMAYIKATKNTGLESVNNAIDVALTRQNVSISEADYKFILDSLPKMKNGNYYKNDLEIFYTLYCLYKGAKESGRLKDDYLSITKKKHIKVDGKKKRTFFNFNSIMKMSGTSSYRDSLNRMTGIDGVEIVD